MLHNVHSISATYVFALAVCCILDLPPEYFVAKTPFAHLQTSVHKLPYHYSFYRLRGQIPLRATVPNTFMAALIRVTIVFATPSPDTCNATTIGGLTPSSSRSTWEFPPTIPLQRLCRHWCRVNGFDIDDIVFRLNKRPLNVIGDRTAAGLGIKHNSTIVANRSSPTPPRTLRPTTSAYFG